MRSDLRINTWDMHLGSTAPQITKHRALLEFQKTLKIANGTAESSLPSTVTSAPWMTKDPRVDYKALKRHLL